MKFFNNKRQEREEYQDMINASLLESIEDLKKKIDELPAKSPPSTAEFANRVADLEVKMSKLWTLLVEVNAQGKDKLTSYGKKFGGRSRDRL